jgi:single-strand DNA-binding protein
VAQAERRGNDDRTQQVFLVEARRQSVRRYIYKPRNCCGGDLFDKQNLMVNRVILIGNLGQQPEVRRLENGTVVAKLSLATNENYKDKSGEWQTTTEWHDVVLWRHLAEKAENLPKGAQLYVEGKLTHRTWQDKDGNNRRTTEVVASYFRHLNRKSDGDSGRFPSEEPARETFTATGTTVANSRSTPAPEVGADEDLPF